MLRGQDSMLVRAVITEGNRSGFGNPINVKVTAGSNMASSAISDFHPWQIVRH